MFFGGRNPVTDETASPFSPPDDIDPAALERVMSEVPKGALALAATSVVLLMLCWLAIYIFVFLPRGSVG